MMHEHSCATVRDQLEAFHDGELTVEQRAAVQAHLGDCVTCSLAAAELADLGLGLRDMASRIAEHDATDPSRVSAQVVERLRVEESLSLRVQVSEWFQDMHLVWAGLGASIATLICVVGSASVLHATSQERPNSMARAISVLASPGSNDNPLRLNYEMMAPRAASAASIDTPHEDFEYALSAVVSREGRVQGVELINQPADARVNAVLNEAYRMQFAPATDRGDAVAVSMVWLVANTTVKGRHDETMEALRQALRLRRTPQPIAPLPIPAEVLEPKPAAAPLVKPVVPETYAAVGGI